MSLYPSAKPSTSRTGLTEFEILKSSHKFLRDDEDDGENKDKAKTWNDLLAEKYYASLYREFAVCDLKHYKSGNFALRWRTEDEVLSGAGETTCANTRCDHHHPAHRAPLTTLELPFAYEEHGESKSALVKVVLCDRCMRKIMYKRNKEKERAAKSERESQREEKAEIKGAKPGEPGDRGHRKRYRDQEHNESLAESREGHRRKRRHSRSPPKPDRTNVA